VNYDCPAYNSTIGKAVIRLLDVWGFPNHRIASLFDVNQGRISEVLTANRPPKEPA